MSTMVTLFAVTDSEYSVSPILTPEVAQAYIHSGFRLNLSFKDKGSDLNLCAADVSILNDHRSINTVMLSTTPWRKS